MTFEASAKKGRDSFEYFGYTKGVMIWRVVIGLVIMVFGFIVVWKTDFFMEWLGPSEFAEAKLGPGRSKLFYKLIGCAICFIGIMIATNLIQETISSVFGPLFSSF